MKFLEEARHVSHGRPGLARDAGAVLSRLLTGFYELRAAWAARRQRAQGVERLRAFSDWELKDVGLCRSDLPSIADGTYRRT